jgi:predicted nucleotide-binding protein
MADGARSQRRKIFISHGQFGPAFTKLETFIRAAGCVPVYDAEEPTAGRSINQHVQHLFESADFYVILAAVETSKPDGTKLPNHNVIVELDRLQRDKADRLLLLVEEGCRMPSMLQDVIRQSFTPECMDLAFTKLAAELTRLALR